MSTPSPVSFAKGLSDPLQVNRLKALASFNAWMDRFGASYEFTPIEVDQVWRSLQLTMWMADKRPVQQQVAAETVLTTRKISPELVSEWNRGFWFNMERIYETIDKHRIPKFHLFIRIYVAEMFHQMNLRGWDAEFVAACVEGIVTNLHKAVGASIQLMTVFLPELQATVGENEPFRSLIKPRSVFHSLLQPAFHAVKDANNAPISVLSRTLDLVLLDERVINYSVQTRALVKGKLQAVAMDRNTGQDVRDVLFAAIDRIDAIPQLAVPKKTQPAPVETKAVTALPKKKKSTTTVTKPILKKKKVVV